MALAVYSKKRSRSLLQTGKLVLARINIAFVTKTEVSSFLVIVELCLFLLLFLVDVLFFVSLFLLNGQDSTMQ